MNPIGRQENRKTRRIMDEARNFSTLLGEASILNGHLLGKDNCLVYGHVIGNCELEGVLVVGESGAWKGDIIADNIVISGSIEGNITAHNKLEMTASARVQGSIVSPSIAMAEGAVHDGKIKMTKDGRISHFQEKRKAESSTSTD